MSYWITLTKQFPSLRLVKLTRKYQILHPGPQKFSCIDNQIISSFSVDTIWGAHIVCFYNILIWIVENLKFDLKLKRANCVNFSLFFEANDLLIAKKSDLFVLKKFQTNLKTFKQLQFPNILSNKPNFASNTSFVCFFRPENHKSWFRFPLIYLL